MDVHKYCGKNIVKEEIICGEKSINMDKDVEICVKENITNIIMENIKKLKTYQTRLNNFNYNNFEKECYIMHIELKKLVEESIIGGKLSIVNLI
jgi:hypothetical protein